MSTRRIEYFREELDKGVVRYGSDGSWPKPHIGICAGLHGNEKPGIVALRELSQAIEHGSLPLRQGTVYLIEGNPEAIAQENRHTDGGIDLNRLWSFDYETQLQKECWRYEHYRAQQMRAHLATCDALLDLHTASSPTPAFAIGNGLKGATDIIGNLGVHYYIENWDGLGELIMVGYLATKGIPSVVVECGSHWEAASEAVALRVARKFLDYNGIASHQEDGASEAPVAIRITETISKPSTEFKFTKPLHGFDKIAAGTILAHDKLTSIHIRKDCYAVLPNDTVAVGHDAVYLGVEAK